MDTLSTSTRNRDHELEHATFPAVFFLDASVFKESKLEIPTALLSTPNYIEELLGGDSSIRETVSTYFETVHGWMAIIPKKQFHIQQLNPLSQRRLEATLLLLCMKLIVWLPTAGREDAKTTTLYKAAKSFHSELEITGTCSLKVLQAGILIALYEFGHGIYPAAYLSIGACARYGIGYGFDDEGAVTNDSHNWVEVEERKRTWWAVLILDRCVTIGNPTRVLATQDPPTFGILPIDDAAWDEGIPYSGTLYTLASPSSINMGRFARFVQAVYLLGRVLRHVADQDVNHTFHKHEATQLYRTLLALVNLSEVHGNIKTIEFCSQVAICYNALLILHKSHNSTTVELLPQMEQNLSIGEAVPKRAVQICRHFLADPAYPIGQVSPLLIPYIYHSASAYVRGCHGASKESYHDNIGILNRGLTDLSRRWQSAGALP
ncbi:hypothetical protein F5884DRAFT_858927 [Xylogone sp. PMI_703]|nr:hypothetical protein F5884DRAFT_858927 [Xylogone sp. PMI_703]